MNEEDLRDCFAMFAMNGLISRGRDEMLVGGALCKAAYDYADAMLEARKPKESDDEEDVGIARVAPKRNYRRKS
jgi:hypothetical protein